LIQTQDIKNIKEKADTGEASNSKEFFLTQDIKNINEKGDTGEASNSKEFFLLYNSGTSIFLIF